MPVDSITQTRNSEFLLNTVEAAKRLGVSKKTLEFWRWRGGGPVFIKLGAAVRYRISDLDAYIAERECEHTAQTTRRRKK